MTESRESDAVIRFGVFEMDPRACELRRDGRRVRLQVQPFKVLEYLVANAGEVVTREALREEIWPSNVYVDFDHGLNNAVNRLRIALEDSSESPRYIETLPRIGYRFVYPVDVGAKVAPSGNEQDLTDAETLPRTSARRRLTVPLLAIGAATVIGLLATVLLRSAVTDSAATTAIRSIAVLPFRNLSADAEQAYLATGLTDALITRLAQLDGLQVVAGGDRASDGDSPDSPADIARALDVDGVVDASVLRVGDQLRVQLQLIRRSDASYLWARSYEGTAAEIFDLQQQVGGDLATEVAALARSGSRVAGTLPGTRNAAAYDLYLRGRHLWDQRRPDALATSVDYFEQAIALDPGFAAAYAGLAEVLATLGGGTLVKAVPAAEVRPAALAAARRALELDDRLAESHAAMGQVLDKLEPASAATDARIEAEYRRALALDPSYATAHLWFGNYLSARQRHAEAIAHYRQALRLDPLSPNIISRLGMALMDTGQVDEGMQFMTRAVEIEPWQFNARIRLGLAYAAQARYAEAAQEFAVAGQVSPANPHVLAGQAYVAARRGDTERARAMLDELRSGAESIDDPFLVAIVYVGLQNRDEALEWLERAAQSSKALRKPGPYGLDDPIYDWLRDDPRFRRILQLASRGQPDDVR